MSPARTLSSIDRDGQCSGNRRSGQIPSPQGRLLTYAIAGHHGGTPNGTGVDEGTLDLRLVKRVRLTRNWGSTGQPKPNTSVRRMSACGSTLTDAGRLQIVSERCGLALGHLEK
jgi:hypothetical protein